MLHKKAIVIGSGFAGLSAASFLAKNGCEVTIVEKHATPGGRARSFSAHGFTFDMGPSWYWMPDVFDRYFAQFGKKTSDYYSLERLDPSYRVYWPEEEATDIPANYDQLKKVFESIEPGSGEQLDKFLIEAAYKYEVGIQKLVFKPSQSFTEFINPQLISGIFKLDVFSTMKKHVAKYFNNPRLTELMEFPVLFLGALPEKTPALYSLMNYADIKGGTWYPQGGMVKIAEGMHQLATSLGVKFVFNADVQQINTNNKEARGISYKLKGESLVMEADVIVAAADYHHVETKLLSPIHRTYNDNYWNSRVMAPSCLLYYVGLNKKLKNIAHHSLFFDTSFAQHGKEIYTTKEWPSDPLFYVSATSVTDESVAPAGCENLFLLIPIASGLNGDSEEIRKKYFEAIVKRMESKLGETIKESIIYYRSFAVSDFIDEYNSFKGNAYGLANTLLQTAVLKPSCRSKKLKNLFYAGQLTVPGPGVPPSLISGEVVANEIVKFFNS
ncbi:MAG: phytoene desaturase [Bacteroidota bacterium]